MKHIERTNYVARIWRQAAIPVIDLEEPNLHGWNADMTIDWISDPFPQDVSELLLERNSCLDEMFKDYDDEDSDCDDDYEVDSDSGEF